MNNYKIDKIYNNNDCIHAYIIYNFKEKIKYIINYKKLL